MNHEMGLQKRYFDYIKNGTKRIELRLYDEKRSQINLGDTIEFINNDDETNKLSARVIGLLRYQNFPDLFNDFDVDILADESISKEELLGALGQFYTAERQQQCGVIGIRIELI